MEEHKCCICGEVFLGVRRATEFACTGDGKVNWFHEDCYREECAHGQRRRSQVAGKISGT